MSNPQDVPLKKVILGNIMKTWYTSERKMRHSFLLQFFYLSISYSFLCTKGSGLPVERALAD